MKLRRKKKKLIPYYTISIVIVLLLITVGYSLFSDQLGINGSVYTVSPITGDQLNISLSQTGGRYTTGSLPSGALFQNENLSGNNLTVNFIKANKKNGIYTASLTINFTNSYAYKMTNGIVSTQKIAGSTLTVTGSSLTQTTIMPGSTGSFTTNFSFNNRKATTPSSLKTTVQYNVFGVTQYFYYNIIIN